MGKRDDQAPAQAAPAGGGGYDFDSALEAAQSGEYSAASSASGPPVYVGENAGSTTHAGKEMPGGERLPAPSDKTVGYDKAMTMIFRDGVQQRFIDLLLRHGLIERGDFNWDDVESWWKLAVDGAARMRAATHRDVTPYQFIEMGYGKGSFGGEGGLGGEEDTGPSTTTDVTKTFTEIDDLDARAAATEAYTALMGKAPKGKEAEAVHAMLEAYAQAHPSISRVTARDDGEGNIKRTVKNSGGFSPAAASQLVEDHVKSRPGYGEYQAATTYFNALQQALGATADV
jgi:hypothetical protein